jgi:hypothetical protein
VQQLVIGRYSLLLLVDWLLSVVCCCYCRLIAVGRRVRLSVVVGCSLFVVVVGRSFVVCWLLLAHVGRLLSVVECSCPQSVLVVVVVVG